jgi:PhnB protein
MAKKPVKKPAKKKPVKKPAKKSVKKPVKKTVAKKVVKPARRPARKPTSQRKAVPVPAEKQTILNTYLTFNGNCEDAFNFYRSVFGGEFVMLSRFKEMPPTEGNPPVPDFMAERIMHVSLPLSKDAILMGSDAMEIPGRSFVRGNNLSVYVSAKSKEDADRFYAGLSAGGRGDMPMNTTFWGSYFGMLEDKFGIQWMISFDPDPQNR